MKIIGFTCTYNEEKMIPYVMPYIQAFGYDKFFVYDNMSTDRTVELLKEYPFVVVIPWDTGGKFDEEAKCRMQLQSFLSSRKMAHIGEPNEELIWMTWTDFDEVLFCNTDGNFRGILEGDYKVRGYNYFCKNMINLFPPRGSEEFSPNEYLHSGQLFHTYPNVRGNVWVGGMKPTMFAVNDFNWINFHPGNHYASVVPSDGKEIKNYDELCRLYAFHLKFIDKNSLVEKWKGYYNKGSDGYLWQIENASTIYEGQIGITFPIENYFLADYFDSALVRNAVPYNGVTVSNKVEQIVSKHAKKRLVFHWFCPNEGMDGSHFSNTNIRNTNDIVNFFTLHKNCLKHYANIFDEAIFVLAKEDKVTDEQIAMLQDGITNLGFKNLRFVVRNNNANGECDTYTDFVINSDDFDGMVFYCHTKGVTHKFDESMVDWVTAMYFFNLEYVSEIEKALKTHAVSGIFKVSDFEDARNYIYSGNVFWFNNKRLHEILNKADLRLFIIENRWWCESFIGRAVKTEEAHSIGNFLTKWDDYKECFDHIVRCVGEERANEYLKFRNTVALNGFI